VQRWREIVEGREMQYKYGDTTPGRPKTLFLALSDEDLNPSDDPQEK